METLSFNDHVQHERDAREKISDKIDNLRDNHFAHLAIDVAGVKADVAWLKKFFWVVATASIGSFVAALWQLFAK